MYPRLRDKRPHGETDLMLISGSFQNGSTFGSVQSISKSNKQVKLVEEKARRPKGPAVQLESLEQKNANLKKVMRSLRL